MQRQAPDLRTSGGPSAGKAAARPGNMPRGKMLEECARASGGPYSVSRSGAHLIAGRTGAVRRSRPRPVVSDRWGSYQGPHRPREPSPSGSRWLIITQDTAT